MAKNKEPIKEETPKVPSSATVLLMFATIADTTWRMFVPIIGLVILGVWLDNLWHTKPWLTVAGTVLGIIISFALIVQQMKRNED